ncbi:unnamed protein product [Trichogramma brassicae]|uniref:Uncharacterized protein n=1 Tax=Trichogramma brassicae TaxID=86971 RepID=A0A6H5IYD4_9HYME|nr:unnamed protein product [Trichogramma brassicae]
MIGNDDRPCHQDGFLPIQANPVTQYDTVYTCLCTLNDIAEQLVQSELPVVCDEGVYKIARHITLLRGEEFKKLFVMLGGFHMLRSSLAEFQINRHFSRTNLECVRRRGDIRFRHGSENRELRAP